MQELIERPDPNQEKPWHLLKDKPNGREEKRASIAQASDRLPSESVDRNDEDRNDV